MDRSYDGWIVIFGSSFWVYFCFVSCLFVVPGLRRGYQRVRGKAMLRVVGFARPVIYFILLHGITERRTHIIYTPGTTHNYTYTYTMPTRIRR
ncbi:hypothetical protein QBC36DRAFT_35307 [Triangularia setosa]|uniref:Uncharacterized protein n=1 Tax=Triangularia setosa TaxID=2587417 RepID=A0AAN6W3I7_9PEZI|nr:hypothetical protein QBC36DRAFT_35307 [Podospora setosa]